MSMKKKMYMLSGQNWGEWRLVSYWKALHKLFIRFFFYTYFSLRGNLNGPRLCSRYLLDS
jgi:hypothetical protein